MSSFAKVKDIAKFVEGPGENLARRTLETMARIADIVGATLGPGGRPVIIERQEYGLPSYVTKDGVTVFRSLGFDNPLDHCIMELARDAAVRTAAEAGDGTTTATILAESIVRRMGEYCSKNTKMSPQKVVRHLELAFKQLIQPSIVSLARSADLASEEGQALLHSVATVSANGDTKLADAVMECYKVVGDDGNVTLAEMTGPSAYEVESMDGFPISLGFEECCHSWQSKFINDPGNQRVFMERPVFFLYHGRLNDIQTLLPLLNKVSDGFTEGIPVVDENGQPTGQRRPFNHNLVIVATGFADSVLANLALNFAADGAINPYPLLAPVFPTRDGQLHFLQDLAAITGAKIFDPVNDPVSTAELSDLGNEVTYFEATRVRSNIVGGASGDDDGMLAQITNIQQQLKSPLSEFDADLLRNRLGKLTGGIAKLKIFGSSNGETKEKRDRAEDAVCAVRGAMKHGVLPAGGWTLLRLIHDLTKFNDPVFDAVLCPALLEPVERLYRNAGLHDDEIKRILEEIRAAMDEGKDVIYDAMEGEMVDPWEKGLLDSTPAVMSAVQNALSIASLLGILGGAVVFKRDAELERSEARDTANWVRDANVNPANERA